MDCRVDPETAYHVVKLILNGRTEEAVDLLSEYFGVDPPKLAVKRPKGVGKALAVYVARKETIYFTRGEYYSNPLIVLHEFYHHLRMFEGKHRGTERNADAFALCIVERARAYTSLHGK